MEACDVGGWPLGKGGSHSVQRNGRTLRAKGGGDTSMKGGWQCVKEPGYRSRGSRAATPYFRDCSADESVTGQRLGADRVCVSSPQALSLSPLPLVQLYLPTGTSSVAQHVHLLRICACGGALLWPPVRLNMHCGVR